MTGRVDLLIYNAHIITLDPQLPEAEALAVTNGYIFAVGDTKELESLRTAAEKVIDLRGRTLLPGFIDTHAHLAGLGRQLLNLDLGGATSSEEVLRQVQERVKEIPAGKLVLGYNYDESEWTNPHYLTRTELDPISPKNPVILFRACGHLASVNTRAFQLLDVDFSHPGVDKHSQTGEPTGVLRDISIDTRKIQSEDKILSETILEACKYANRVGITSVHENLYLRQLPFIGEYVKLRQKDQLTVRVYANLEAKMLDRLAALGLPSGLGDKIFRLGGVKVFIDGSLGAQTAALFKPYNDKPDSDGLLLSTEADYRFLLEIANNLGLQVSTHAIGDRGIDLVLRCHEMESKVQLVKQHRHNLIHAEFLTTPLMKRVKQLDMLLLMQPNFVHRWGLPGGLYDQRLGSDRAQQLNNFRRILDMSISVAFGSDCMPMDPIYGIYSVVTHPNPAVSISVEEALRLYTSDAAFASFEENDKGTITVGKLADFVVLSQNPLIIDPTEFQRIKVEQTYVGGRLVYSRI